MFIFYGVFLPWKHQLYIFSYFETFNYLIRFFFWCLFSSKIQHFYFFSDYFVIPLAAPIFFLFFFFGLLFVLSLYANMFFHRFSGFLSSKRMNHTDDVPVSTINTIITHIIYLCTTAKNVLFMFHDVVWPSKIWSCVFCYFETCNYVKRYLVCFLFACK